MSEKMPSEDWEKEMTIELTDGVVLLKPFRLEDAEQHLAGEDEEEEKWLSGGKSTMETVHAFIERSQASWEHGGPTFTFAVWSVESNQLIGMVEANTDSGKIEGLQEGDANISYSLYPEARGKGYITRAVNLVTEFLQEKVMKRALIRVNPENVSSLNVPMRTGFKETEGITTKNGEQLRVFIKELQDESSQ